MRDCSGMYMRYPSKVLLMCFRFPARAIVARPEKRYIEKDMTVARLGWRIKDILFIKSQGWSYLSRS